MSKPTFTFGNAGTDGSPGVFGQPSNSNQSGSSSNATGSNPFGGGATTQQSSIFGGSTQPASSGDPFNSLSATAGSQKPLTFGGNTASTPASGTSTPSLFGASTGNAGGSGLFGGTSNTTAAPNPFGGAGFTFGKKAEEKNENSAPAASGFPTAGKTETSQASSGGLFRGAGTASAPSPFGAASTPSSAPAGSTTPATSKAGGLFGFANSTTPAGPPPADANTGPKPSLFGSSQPSSSGLFGSLKAADSATKPATTQRSNTFGALASTGVSSSNAFAPKTTTSSSGAGLFGGLNTTKAATIDSIGTSTSLATVPKPSFSFTSTGTVSSPLTITQAPNLFGAAGSSSSTPAATTNAPTPSLFGSATSATSSGPAPSQSSSLFANLGKSNTTVTSATTSVPNTTISAQAPSLFTPKATQATNGTVSATSAAEKETTTSSAPAAASSLGTSISTPLLAASGVGPAPQLSRLKNKTMDEIITRWATDLSTYQKEFQNQAAKVASWDRLLVENGDKIQKLYTSTFEAERASAEVERQLASVESQQDELTAWLDHYEREVDDMFIKQVGHGETLQGPDQERERTYKLAEKLTDRLDEMGRDLTSMIQEINTASATLTKTSKPDDPLSQIVRVLNGHLSQLQWIDQNAAALQTKIAAAQKTAQSIGSNGYGGAENDPADEFYRSYMGRR